MKTSNDYGYNSLTQKIKRDGAGVCYFYPSDLAELTLVPYKESKGLLAGAEEQVSSLQPANLRLRLDNQAWYQFIPCIYYKEKGILYISEENFNQYWKEIRYKLMGHYIAKERMRTVTKEELDRRVSLEEYLSETRDAKIVDARIVVFTKLPEEERLRLSSKRASMMDNRKILYIFDRKGGPVHDKSCELVKGIALEDFCGSEEMPESRVFCGKCRRRLHIRLACGPDFKNCRVYESFLKRCAVSELELEYFVREHGGQMFMESFYAMRLKCREDTWRVERKEDGLLVLYHNNYVMINEEERFITDGFHEQNIFARRLDRILQYIEDYTWQGHLEAKRSETEDEQEYGETGSVKSDNETLDAAGVAENKKDMAAQEQMEMQELKVSSKVSGWKEWLKRCRIWWLRWKTWLRKWF